MFSSPFPYSMEGSLSCFFSLPVFRKRNGQSDFWEGKFHSLNLVSIFLMNFEFKYERAVCNRGIIIKPPLTIRSSPLLESVEAPGEESSDVIKEQWARGSGICLQSQCSWGRGKRISVSSRPVCSALWVLGQMELLKESLSETQF